MPTIFLLEKDSDIRFILETSLTKQGYIAYSYSSLESMIEALRILTPELLLIDYHATSILGDKNLCKELKMRYSFPNKIILLSTVDIPKEEWEVLLVDGIITKPFDLSVVHQTINAALQLN